MWWVLFPFVVVAGAMLNRHRGGWLGTGHTELARADFAFGTMLLYLGLTLDWHGAFIVFVGTLLGTLPGQGEDQAADTWPKQLRLIGSGTINMAGVGLGVWWANAGHPVPPTIDLMAFPVFWLLAGPGKLGSYLLGKILPGTLIPTLFGQGFARGDTEWGEILFGAVEGALLFAMVS